MQLKHLTSLALAGLVSGASLTEVISQTPDLSTLGTILEQYPAVASVLANATNITVLAPSNAALAAFLTPAVTAAVQADPGLVTAVLLYHVLSGTIASTDITATPTFAKTLLTNATYTNVTGGQVIKAQSDDDGGVVFTSGLLQESHVTTADVEFDGGLVHIIDSVLTIPQSDSATALAANLTALAGALTQADLVSTVDGLEDVTIFAPTNDAFAAIASLVGGLSLEQLSSILTYHVVQGTVGYSTTLQNGATITTVEGASVKVTISGSDVYINSAKVVVADVLVSNGVVHVIDGVLNPSNSTATPNVTVSGSPPAFSGAASGSPSGTATPTTTLPATAGGPMKTAAVGAAALFGGAAFLANF